MAGNENIIEKVAYNKLKEYLITIVGLNVDGYRPEYFQRRLGIRMRGVNMKSYSEYLRFLRANSQETKLLLNDLTINYTSFFRDTDVYDFLRKTVFPELLISKSLRIWSAGCATGEEPYSLSILLHELLKEKIQNYFITIHASDVDRDALEKAGKGQYPKSQVHGLSAEVVSKYFSREGENFTVKEFVKKPIRFGIHDLMKPFLHTNLDLILCRNVMIYFTREGQQQVHMNFFRGLRDGGFMVIGKAEMLSGEPAAKFATVDMKCRVYRKPARSLSFEPSVMTAATDERQIRVH